MLMFNKRSDSQDPLSQRGIDNILRKWGLETGYDITYISADMASINLQNITGGDGRSAQNTSYKSALPLQLSNMVSYKCAGNNCSLSFPLPEKTSENVITCPLEECGTETNIWSRRKRIVELKRDHEAARGKIEGISGVGGMQGIDDGINMLKNLIGEWDAMVARPNKCITSLEEDLTKALLLKHIESEQTWIKDQSTGFK